MKTFSEMTQDERDTLFDSLEDIPPQTRYRLKFRREELGLTQNQVAQIAEMQLRQYQRLESGETKLTASSFSAGVRVCYALQLDPFDLVISPKIRSNRKEIAGE